jgi:hypothetical protein
MSALLRSMLLLALTGALLVGCGEKAEEATEAEAPMAEEATAVEAPAAEAAATSGGGYVPTDDERVPGITIDPSELETSDAEAE